MDIYVSTTFENSNVSTLKKFADYYELLITY